MKVSTLKLFNSILSVIIIIASVMLCHQIISNAIINQQDKNDYAELNHVKYGLFSVDEWKRQINAILAEEIDKLDLSRTDERELRKHIEVLLNTLIDKVYKKIREENEGSAGGRLKQSIINMLVSPEDVKKGIPEYADAIMHEMTKSKTKGQIKTMLNKQLEQYFNQTFDTQNTARLSSILLRTGSNDIKSARIKLNRTILDKDDLIVKEAVVLIILSVILFALSGFSKQTLAPSQYILLVLSLIILLIAGVTTPMIDMEAKISQMSFMLMGHPILFENQVLYFQSKSILDVFLDHDHT